MFGDDGRTAAGKLRLKYLATASGYTLTCDGRWVSFELRLNPDSV